MDTLDEKKCGLQTLNFDEACVYLTTHDEDRVKWLYTLSSECLECPYKKLTPIMPRLNSTEVVRTVRAMKWRVLDTDDPVTYVSAKNLSNVFCEVSPKLGQYGRYLLQVTNEGCNVETIIQPTYPYTELFVILGVLILLLLGISCSRSLWNVYKKRSLKHGANEVTSNEATKRRVKAIDTFRGASTLLMIFVNSGAGGYPILYHATWNGLLIGDLVFPCFIWIMGVCIPIALSSQIKRMTPKRTICTSIIKRSILLFLIGVSLNTVGSARGPELKSIRIFGVLQRFGVTYLIVALTYLFLVPKEQKKVQSSVLRKFQDCLMLLPQWCIMIVIVTVHCALTFSLHVPGCPTGYLGPGGRHEDGKYFECTGGAAGYVDKVILNQTHIYQHPQIRGVYGSGPFDPEGILGCLTSAFQVFLGVQAGVIMMSYKNWKERVVRWLLWATTYGCIGCILHFTNAIPVNKSLWSLSFVFVTTSFALAFLSGCYLLVDVMKIWRGGPFRVPGMNALVLYVGHIVCYQMFPFHWLVENMYQSRTLLFVESIWCVGFWATIAYIMHRKRTYIAL